MLVFNGGSLFGCSIIPKKETVTLVPALVLSIVMGMVPISPEDEVAGAVVI